MKSNEIKEANVGTELDIDSIGNKITGGMKEGIHPDYQAEISLDAHPYFTGQQKSVQAGGRVDKFRKKYGM